MQPPQLTVTEYVPKSVGIIDWFVERIKLDGSRLHAKVQVVPGGRFETWAVKVGLIGGQL